MFVYISAVGETSEPLTVRRDSKTNPKVYKALIIAWGIPSPIAPTWD